MADEPNFILVPYADRQDPRQPSIAERLRAAASSLGAMLPFRALTGPQQEADTAAPDRPRLVFGFDATASREPAWATARQVTDALVRNFGKQFDLETVQLTETT